jgi:hypothetical protein
MTALVTAQPRVAARSQDAVWTLARIEARRMLCHPAPWIGIGLSCWFGSLALRGDSVDTGQYPVLLVASLPMLLGVSLASVSAFGRELMPVSDDAPMTAATRSMARLLGALSLVAVVAVVVASTGAWLRFSGGIPLGEEPGFTLHAHYTLPELLQPVLLACFAVAIGSAAVHLLRNRLLASIVTFLMWTMTSVFWWMAVGPLQWLVLLQVQPGLVDVGPQTTDPMTFPEDWLLARPNEFQDFWARLVVSPALAAWHDLYLIGLTMLAVAAAIPGRWRRHLAIGGALVAGLAVLMQSTVAP